MFERLKREQRVFKDKWKLYNNFQCDNLSNTWSAEAYIVALTMAETRVSSSNSSTAVIPMLQEDCNGK